MRNLANRIVAIILLTGLAYSLSLARPSEQAPAQTPAPSSVEERRKAMERLVEQMQKNAASQQPPPAAPAPPPQAPAPTPPIPAVVQRAPAASGQVQLNYENAELYEFINQMTDMLGITPIVIDPDVKGSVTIHSSGPMSRDDVLPLFNLILKNNNASIIKQGNIYQIVPTSAGIKRGLEVIEHTPPAASPASAKPGGDADQKTPPTGTQPPAPAAPPATSAASSPAPQQPAPPPRLATHVVRAEFVPVRDLIEPLKLFMTEGGVIMPYERLNLLILTDYSDSLSKVLEIIHLLDNSYLNADLIELVKIKNNASQDVVDDLKKIFGGTKDATTGVNLISFDRMNSILVMTNSKRALAEVKRWIDVLDASSGRSIQTFVYTVENSTATNIAMILSALYGGEGTMPTGTGTSSGLGRAGGMGVTGGTSFGSASQMGGGYAAGPTPFGGQAMGGQTGMSGFGGQSTFGGGGFGTQGGYMGGGYGSMGGYGGFGAFSTGSQLGPRLNQGPSVSAQILRGGELVGLQGMVRVVVDEINNSLIIQSSAADYAYISETIKKMDVLPRQAIIDARIFEVDLTDAFAFGVSAALQPATAGQHNTTATLSSLGALSASTFAFVGNSREILANLDMLRQKTRVRVLEAPSVLALDGTPAHIVVGGEVPYPAGSYTGAVGSTTSVQYRDTGVQLLVMPRISASGTVTLEVAQEVSAPGAPATGSENLGPTFNKTSVSTTLAVKDGETVAIAGLIRDSRSWSRTGVPFLSDLPILGYLFGRTGQSGTRTELLILITPHVIRTPERAQEMTQDLRDSLRNVRTFADEKKREATEDLEAARKERYEQEKKETAKTPPKKQ